MTRQVLIMTATFLMLPLVFVSGSADATSKPTCLKVDPKFADNVLSGTKPGAGVAVRVGSAMAYRSPAFSKVYFLAIAFRAAGSESSVVGVWAANALSGSATILAVDPVAKKYTDWSDGFKSEARIASNDRSVAIAKTCQASPTKVLVAAEAVPDDKVDWNNYAASVRTRIARRIVAVDCAGLQAGFNIALENNVAQRRRDPKGNIPRMDYLDKSMRAIGCYD